MSQDGRHIRLLIGLGAAVLLLLASGEGVIFSHSFFPSMIVT